MTSRKILDIALALLAHIAVGVSWVAVAASVMGSLDVARRMVMNSEFAWDTGRLPQPWVIPLALVAAWVSHRFFLWAMRRAGDGKLLWGARVVAWSGALLGVLLGVYLWTPTCHPATTRRRRPRIQRKRPLAITTIGECFDSRSMPTVTRPIAAGRASFAWCAAHPRIPHGADCPAAGPTCAPTRRAGVQR